MGLEEIARQVRGCTLCRLAESRTHAVPGHGSPTARLVLVGEAPGRREDETGLPFQGASGQFLDRCLEAVGLRREDIFVTSVNKCRPPRNRTPRTDEQLACQPYLAAQLAQIQPVVVLAMGQTAARVLHPAARAGVTLESLRGPEVTLPEDSLGAGARLLVSCHPAAAMRFPSLRPGFLEDLAAAARLAD